MAQYCLQCRRPKFDPRVRKIWRRKQQPTLVFLPGKSMDRGAWQATVHGVPRVRYNLVTKPPPQSAKKIPILKEAWVLILDLSPETKKQTFLVQILNLPFSICAILGKLFKFSILSFPHLLNEANHSDYFWVISSTKWASTHKTKQCLISTVWESATIIICYRPSSPFCLAVS